MTSDQNLQSFSVESDMKLFTSPIHSASLVIRTTTVIVMLNTLHQWWFCLGIYSFTLPALHITFTVTATLLVSNFCMQQNFSGVCEITIRIRLRLTAMTTVSQLYACMIVHTYIVHLCMHKRTHICTHTNISIMCTYECTRVHGTDWNTLLLHLVSGNRHFQSWSCSCYTLSSYALSLYNAHWNTRMDHFQLQR